jgi:hypothetical protein
LLVFTCAHPKWQNSQSDDGGRSTEEEEEEEEEDVDDTLLHFRTLADRSSFFSSETDINQSFKQTKEIQMLRLSISTIIYKLSRQTIAGTWLLLLTGSTTDIKILYCRPPIVSYISQTKLINACEIKQEYIYVNTNCRHNYPKTQITHQKCCEDGDKSYWKWVVKRK